MFLNTASDNFALVSASVDKYGYTQILAIQIVD